MKNREDVKAQTKNGRKIGIFLLVFFVRLGAFAMDSHAQTTAPAKVAIKGATNPQNAALLAFKREQIASIQAEVARGVYNPEDVSEAITKIEARATQIERATGDAASTIYTLHERAYFAPDGSPQPFWIALPTNYSPRQKWPLAVYLHGYSDGISKIAPWLPSAEIIEAATKRGIVLAIPYGRRNSDFVQWGQDDVLKVKNEAMRLYSIDKARVFLTGASMGGYGAFATALHDVSQWRAVAPICGRTDFYLWFQAERDALPAWKRALYDADDPRFLISNALDTPFLVQHGALDWTVPVDHSRRIAADARRLGLPLQYIEQPEGDHNFEFQLSAVSRAFQWFLTLPTVVAPRKIEFVAVDPREAKNGWASIETFETYGQKATLKVEIQTGSVAVTTQNVASFVLEPPDSFFADKRLLKLSVNGTETPSLFDPLLPIRWQKAGAKLEKTPLRAGPFKNALRDPFLLVYGDENDQKAAQKFALEWKENADGDATIQSAAQVSAADKAAFNLILFGTRDSNPLLGEIAAQLPLELTKDGYRSGETVVAGEDLGLRLIYKSPWDKNRLIGVCSGIWWGEKLPINHKWDLVPDYIVYNSKTEADDTNAALEAGFFDGNWAK